CCGEHQVKTGIRFCQLGRWRSNTDRPAVAPGRQKSRCLDRCVGQGHCSKHSAAEVVRTRSCSLARVSTPLLGRDTSASEPVGRTAYTRSERTDYTRFCRTP